MADPILNGTMSGITPSAPGTPAPITQPTFELPQGLKVPEMTGNMDADIKSLSTAQQSPNMLMDFMKVMRLTSTQAYNDRQGKELAIEGGAFDPGKVSGGTFAAIIGNLEQNRGQDVGKVYAATVNAYGAAQEQITNRLEFLQQLQESKRQFEAELKLKKKEIKLLEKRDKASASLAKKSLEFEKNSWEREFAFKMSQAKKQSASTEYLASLGIDLGENRSAYEGYKGSASLNYSPLDLYSSKL